MFFKNKPITSTKKHKIEVRLWIQEAEGLFLGIGKIWLLENIQKTGSITNAVKEIKMAYRQAWQLVEEINQRAESLLDEKAIVNFYEIEKSIKDFAQQEFQNLKF
jgi:molybdate transport system regulatory protein